MSPEPDVTPPANEAVAHPEVVPAVSDRPRVGWGTRIGFAAQFFGSLAAVAGVLLALLFLPNPSAADRLDLAAQPSALERAVEVLDTQTIRVHPSSSLAAKLNSAVIDLEEVTTPMIQVVGAVAASLRPAEPEAGDQWQFNDPEALAAYFDHRTARVDLQFAEEQTVRVRQLNETVLASMRTIVERLQRLVAAGTDTRADLQQAEAELLAAEIDGRKDIHEADSDLQRAKQALAVAARQLQLLGLDIDMIDAASSDIDIVVAEVPVDFQRMVRVGQLCEAVFLGMPGEVFPGVVQRISPTLSQERRALRVLFYVDDPDDKLRPGMFAEIGLGTDPRASLKVPATAVIHIGRDEFVLVRDPDQADAWRVTPIEVGDMQAARIEVLTGLEPGSEVITENAILLKPVVAGMLRDRRSGAR